MAADSLVYLVRHSIAESTSAQGDRGRALTPEGRERFEALVQALAPQLKIVRILSSPALRAAETARLLAGGLGLAGPELLDELAPGESRGVGLLALARRAGPGTALVGHNPELSEAVGLAGRRAQTMVPGAIAAVELREDAFKLCWVKAP